MLSRLALALLVGVSALVVPTTSEVAVAQDVAFRSQAVHLLLDISTSMNDADGDGGVRLGGAKTAINALLSGVEDDIRVGLRAFPAPGSDCGPGLLVSPIGQGRAGLDLAVRSLQAAGNTPTSEALEAAAQDLRDFGADDNVIVLVSDGESNCGSNPCETAAGIRATGIDVTVNTIGFNISSTGRDELTCIAETTGGQYRDAENADELADELKRLAAGALDLDLDHPRTVVRAVGQSAGASLDDGLEIMIQTTVSSTGANAASDVEVRVSPSSERRPLILRPLRQLGNLEPGQSRQIEFVFSAPLDFETIDLIFDVTATARNADTVTETAVITLSGSVELADAGQLIRSAENVVILGDSYSSGEGSGGYYADTNTMSNPCHRSPNTYGRDLWEDRTILACSGAIVEDFYSNQYGGVPPQLDQFEALNTPPDLVLMSIGGNDAGFKSVILNCLSVGNCHEKREVAQVECESTASNLVSGQDLFDLQAGFGTTFCYEDRGSFADIKAAEVAGLRQRLVEVYVAVDRAANTPARLAARNGEVAPVVVMAYPLPVPNPDQFERILELCPDQMAFGEWKWVNQFHGQLTAVIREAVAEAQQRGAAVYFAEQVTQAFQPIHTICDDDRYINYIDISDTIDGITAAIFYKYTPARWFWTDLDSDLDINEQFHPNARGYRAMTAALLEFSNSPEATPRERTLDPLVDVIWPPPDGPVFAIAEGDDIELVRGVTSTVELEGLSPGTGAEAQIASTVHLLDRALVGADGRALLSVPLPANLELGDHRLTIAATSADGTPFVRTWSVTVADENPALYAWAPTMAAAAIAMLVTFAAATVFFGRRHRRRLTGQSSIPTKPDYIEVDEEAPISL
jgi:lysophospholipase L1-like esterase